MFQKCIRINKYKIFNYGRIENHRRTITNGSINSHGYSRVSVIPKEYSLHRLVAKVFILNLENKYRINLVHENKANAVKSFYPIFNATLTV